MYVFCRTSYEAAHCWTVAVMFCIHHQVALTDVYLRACAEEDDWLMFLTFAQLHQYPKEQVFKLISCGFDYGNPM